VVKFLFKLRIAVKKGQVLGTFAAAYIFFKNQGVSIDKNALRRHTEYWFFKEAPCTMEQTLLTPAQLKEDGALSLQGARFNCGFFLLSK
jgi:hypothetical protein